jgi:hypothetical protein
VAWLLTILIEVAKLLAVVTLHLADVFSTLPLLLKIPIPWWA